MDSLTPVHSNSERGGSDKRRQGQPRRISSEDRRSLIILAATKVFADFGFHGARTAQIADEANVSEALIYSHFCNKEDLYQTVVNESASILESSFDRILAEVETLPPCTKSLVQLVFSIVKGLGIHRPDPKSHDQIVTRLFLNSLAEDGTFARNFLRNRFARIPTVFANCLAAAIQTEDLANPPPPDLAFWLVHHLAVGMFLNQLPSVSIIQYSRSQADSISEAVRFALRGLGMKEQALHHYLQPKGYA